MTTKAKTERIKRQSNSFGFYYFMFDACFVLLQLDTTRSMDTASTSSESTNRFLAGFSARAGPVGVSVSCLCYVFVI